MTRYIPMNVEEILEKDLPFDAVSRIISGFDQVAPDYASYGYHSGDNQQIAASNELVRNIVVSRLKIGRSYVWADHTTGAGARVSAIKNSILTYFPDSTNIAIVGMDLSLNMLSEASARLDYVVQANLCESTPIKSDIFTIFGLSFGYALFPGMEKEQAEEKRAMLLHDYYNRLNSGGSMLIELSGYDRGSVWAYEKNPVNEENNPTEINQFYLKNFDLDEVVRMIEKAGIALENVNLIVGERKSNENWKVNPINKDKWINDFDWETEGGLYILLDAVKP